jgi:hypothetical protein
VTEVLDEKRVDRLTAYDDSWPHLMLDTPFAGPWNPSKEESILGHAPDDNVLFFIIIIYDT